MLAGINFVGIDPADIALLALFPVLLVIRPSIIKLDRLDRTPRFLIFVFLFLYVVSATINPFNNSFVMNFISNTMLFFVIYFLTLKDKGKTDFSALVLWGFFGINALQAFLMLLPISMPEFIFEAVRDNRYMGFLGDPNLTGLHALVAGLILFDDLMISRRLPIGTPFKIALLVCSIFILFSTQSRSAWLAMLIGMPIYLWMVKKSLDKRRVMTALIFILLTSAVVAVIAVATGQSQLIESRLQSISEQDSEAEEDRFKLVFTVAAISVGLDHPLGTGPGMSITASGLENVDGDPIGAHNAFVQVFADNGWGALLVLVLLLGLVIRRLYRAALANKVFHGMSSAVLLTALLATCAEGMFHDLLSWRIAWIIPAIALLSVTIRPRLPRAAAPLNRRKRLEQ